MLLVELSHPCPNLESENFSARLGSRTWYESVLERRSKWEL